MENQENTPKQAVERQAGQAASARSAVREFAHYLTHEGKWWLTLIIAGWVLVVGALVLGGASSAPVVYKLF